MGPAEKLLMRLPKKFLLIKAEERGLCQSGNKEELARRIANKDIERFSMAWDAIANPKRK